MVTYKRLHYLHESTLTYHLNGTTESVNPKYTSGIVRQAQKVDIGLKPLHRMIQDPLPGGGRSSKDHEEGGLKASVVVILFFECSSR